jgi:hypothetical protein
MNFYERKQTESYISWWEIVMVTGNTKETEKQMIENANYSIFNAQPNLQARIR